MAKKFNITGKCYPERHYMADVSGKLRKIMAMVEEGDYFIINRPRQYGKTTTLSLLNKLLQQKEGYLPFNVSFEGIGDVAFQDEQVFCRSFIRLMAEPTTYSDKALADWLYEKSEKVRTLHELSDFITELIHRLDKKVVVIIDEVDKSSNNQLFVSFLAVLRNKFLFRDEPHHRTFHSVVLAGVHDVKTLKLKIRPDEEQKLNSPWNIATAFKVNMDLQPAEIIPMLEDYARERGVKLDAPRLAEKLFFYTSGYPFLVSNLCKILDEEILPLKAASEWTEADLEAAVNLLLKEGNANFDSLIANLKNNPELYQMTFSLLMDNVGFPYNIQHPTVNLGVLYGVFGNGGQLRIHNRIYQEVIYNYMSLDLHKDVWVDKSSFQSNYLLPNHALDMEKVLLKFQEFMKEQYSVKDEAFLERNGRLLFLAFIKPIINGGGWDFKEPQISEEKRLDVVITFFQHKYVVELKIWRGKEAHEKGLQQLSDYLDLQHLRQGYLLIFDHSKKKNWKKENLLAGGKKVFAVWV